MTVPAVLANVSCATGTFASQLRGSRRSHATSTFADAGRQRRFALSTYRRQPATGRQHGPLASLSGWHPQLQRIQSSRSAFAGRPSLQRLASHIGRPTFNALSRLNSTVLSHEGSSTSPISASAVAAPPPAPSAPSTQIPRVDSNQTPFAQPLQTPLARGLNSDLGFPTDFEEHYALGEEIGAGSFGTVYLAADRETGDSVAVKVLPKQAPPSRHGRGSARAARDVMLGKVKKELDVLQRLQLCGTAVELLGTYEDSGGIYIVMEECRGGDLEALLEDYGPLNEADSARIMYEVLQTVASCHANHLYHGDIKPANFMLKDVPKHTDKGFRFDKQRPGGWLRAIDFGCAQYVEDGAPLTRKTGTPMFMAPEVFIGNYGVEADMWATGMMMYQLLADRFPWWTTMEELHTTTLEAVMQAVIQKDIPMDYGPWKSLSQEGLDLVKRMLTRDAGQRISADEALRHPWFAKHGIGMAAAKDRSASGNIVPLTRRMSDTLRLRMSAAELSRARSRPAAGLSGLLDDMVDDVGEPVQNSADLCATFA